MKKCGFQLALVAVVLSLTAVGWAFRCGDDLVLPGDRAIQVLKSCGEPARRDQWEEVRSGHERRFGRFWPNRIKVQVEEWTYNLGPSHFLQIVRVENGVVVQVEEGNYGF